MRALVSIFTALLIGISLYQLSFTWFVNKHEKEIGEKAVQYIKKSYPAAEQKYPGNKEAQDLYKDSLTVLTNAYRDSLLTASKDKSITWWGQSYQKSKESELLLGLDLQGGINVTMDIALDGLVKGLANNPKDPQLLNAIAEAQKLKLTSDQNFIDLFATAYAKLNPGLKLASQFSISWEFLYLFCYYEMRGCLINGCVNKHATLTFLRPIPRMNFLGIVRQRK